MLHVPHQTACDQQSREPMHVRMPGDQGPFDTTDLIVLAVGIIVAPLRATYFIAHYNHGYTERKHGDGQKVLDLPVAQLLDCGIVGRALDTAVPASVIVSSVTIAFA